MCFSRVGKREDDNISFGEIWCLGGMGCFSIKVAKIWHTAVLSGPQPTVWGSLLYCQILFFLYLFLSHFRLVPYFTQNQSNTWYISIMYCENVPCLPVNRWQALYLFHFQDLVLHLFERTLRFCLLQPGLHQFFLQLQDGLLWIPRSTLLQPTTEQWDTWQQQKIIHICIYSHLNRALKPTADRNGLACLVQINNSTWLFVKHNGKLCKAR